MLNNDFLKKEGQENALPIREKVEEMSLNEIYSSVRPPQLPEKLPRLVAAVTSQTPATYKTTLAQAMFPAFAVYPKHLSFRYIDNQARELRISCLTVGPTGSGKDSCLRQPLKQILHDVLEKDAINRGR